MNDTTVAPYLINLALVSVSNLSNLKSLDIAFDNLSSTQIAIAEGVVNLSSGPLVNLSAHGTTGISVAVSIYQTVTSTLNLSLDVEPVGSPSYSSYTINLRVS